MTDHFDIIIMPGSPKQGYWRDFWQARELLWYLTWRNIVVRYKQTAVGILWVWIRPLLLMLVFSIIFGKVAKMSQLSQTPYPLLVFSGLVPWFFFSNAVSDSSTSLLQEVDLITKVYFPRLFVPISRIFVAIVDLLIMLILLGIIMLIMGHLPPLQALLLPFIIIVIALIAFATGLLLASLSVRFRDAVQVVPFMMQVGIFVSPVFYNYQIFPEPYRIWFFLNPVAGSINLFRWGLLGHELHLPGFLLSSLVTLLILIISVRHFRRVEIGMADFL